MIRLALILVLITGVSITAPARAAEMPQREAVLATGERVADWQLGALGYLPGDKETPAMPIFPNRQEKS